jgi:hypothetical protein
MDPSDNAMFVPKINDRVKLAKVYKVSRKENLKMVGGEQSVTAGPLAKTLSQAASG